MPRAQLPVPVATSGARLAGWAYTAAQTGEAPAAWGTATVGAAACIAATSLKQSPIDVVTSTLSVPTTDPGNITGVGYDTSLLGDLHNDGRNVFYQVTSPIKPYLEGGALTANKRYVFDHMDFHFGSVSTQGSEHTVDAKKYPMELQLVHYDASLQTATLAKASTNTDALAVVSFFFEIDTVDNADLKTITDKLATIAASTATGKKEAGVVVDNLMKIMGMHNIEEYYYYDGSYTVPTCNENVKWIIAPKKLKISEAQLVLFRALKDSDTKDVADNFRPVQAINTRVVMHRKKPVVKKSTQVGQAATILGSTLLGIGTFGTVYNLLQNDATAKALKSNPLLDLIEDFDQKFLKGDEQPAQQFQQQQFQQPQQFQQRYR